MARNLVIHVKNQTESIIASHNDEGEIVLCEVLINGEGGKVNVCKKCMAGEEAEEGYYAENSFCGKHTLNEE